jgi:hypothetical protein
MYQRDRRQCWEMTLDVACVDRQPNLRILIKVVLSKKVSFSQNNGAQIPVKEASRVLP